MADAFSYSQDLSSYFLEADEGTSVIPISYRDKTGLIERPALQESQQESSENSNYEPLGFLDRFVGYAQAAYDDAVSVFEAPSSDREGAINATVNEYASTLESAPAIQSSIERLSNADVTYDDSWLDNIKNTPNPLLDIDPIGGLREGLMNRQSDTTAFRVGDSTENADAMPAVDTSMPVPSGMSMSVPEPKSYDSPYDMSDLEILARTIDAEARGEAYEGKVAVGAVMVNRLSSGAYGSSGGLKGVILKKSQFSPWNSFTGGAGGRQGKNMLGLSAVPGKDSYKAAMAILSGNYKDPTNGATHYVNESAAEGQSWITKMKARKKGTITLGNHIFGNADNNNVYDGRAAALGLGYADKPSTAATTAPTTVLPTGLTITKATRNEVRPTKEKLNISLDFNSSEGARGTEVIIPDDASAEVRAAGDRFNEMVVAFADKYGYMNYKNRGVKTRSQNKRGASNTIHVEPFFTQDAQMQALIKKHPEEFAKLYQDAFGNLSATMVAPHGVPNSKGVVSKGAMSNVFGSELDYGNMILDILLANNKK